MLSRKPFTKAALAWIGIIALSAPPGAWAIIDLDADPKWASSTPRRLSPSPSKGTMVRPTTLSKATITNWMCPPRWASEQPLRQLL